MKYTVKREKGDDGYKDIAGQLFGDKIRLIERLDAFVTALERKQREVGELTLQVKRLTRQLSAGGLIENHSEVEEVQEATNS